MHRTRTFSVLGILLACMIVQDTYTKCAMYHVCEHTEPYDKVRYCNATADQEPQWITDKDSLKTLKYYCPDIAPPEKNEVLTCCDSEQVRTLETSFQAASIIISRCPACFRNFLTIFCKMTCAPNQRDFITTKELDSKKAVSRIEYAMNNNFSYGFYDSLKDVSFGGSKAITVLCKKADCTRDDLFKSLGDGSDRAPFQIDFIFDAPNSMNAPFFSCNQTVNTTGFNGPPCSCSDCKDSCFIPPPKPQPHNTILGIDLYWFIFGTIYIVFVLILIVWHVYKRLSRLDGSEPLLTEQQSNGEFTDEEIESMQEKISCQTQISAAFDRKLSKAFGYLAFYIASYPISTLICSAVITVILCSGLTRFEVTTDPVELWSDPSSRGRIEKNYFDTNFGPFYRTQQLIIKPKNESLVKILIDQYVYGDFGPAWELNFLFKTLDLQKQIANLTVFSHQLNKSVSLPDICFKPLWPDSNKCAITSPLEYFQGNATLLNMTTIGEFDVNMTYANRMLACGQSPTLTGDGAVPFGGTCLSSCGIPMQPNLVFGGYPDNLFNASKTIVMTFLVSNSIDANSDQIRMAKEWELAYVNLVNEWAANNSDQIEVMFTSERSIEDELSRQSEADVLTVLISYLVMFLYVSLCLGSYRSLRTLMVDLKVTLGLGGVLIVVLAVVTSVGIWSWARVPASLIIIEVIPFLVLAVGVDNIFIMVQDFELDGDGHQSLMAEQFQPKFRHFFGANNPNRQIDHMDEASNASRSINYEEIDAEDDEDEVSTMPVGEEASTFLKPHERAIEEIIRRVSRMLARVGPSIFLSSLSEACAFFCGTISTMPAVKVFSMYAGLAILINFFMQIFVFIALMTLDAHRTVARRFDIICCVTLDSRRRVLNVWPERPPPVPSDSETPAGTPDLPSTPVRAPKAAKIRNRPWLYRLVADYLTPAVLSKQGRRIVLMILVTWTCFCLAVIPNGIEIGLDQKLSMPTDSFVLRYFEGMSKYLKIGPPVYFVVTKNHSYTQAKGLNQVCGMVGCDRNSLVSELTKESYQADTSRVVSGPMSWIDDYFDWLKVKDETYRCCRIYKNNATMFCPSNVTESLCQPCNITWVPSSEHGAMKPQDSDFHQYLGHFLDQNPSEICPKGGRAGYHVAVKLDGPVNDVQTSYFMTYQTTLRESADFIAALAQARRITDELNRAWTNRTIDDFSYGAGVPENIVYAYSVFHVFYEQYLSTVRQATLQIGVCLTAITTIAFIVLGFDWRATLVVLLGITLILLSTLAVMALWGITLNALSLVNLVVCVGIAVEFCVHLVRAYTVSLERDRVDRAKHALATMGSSILRGITLTKLGGILVLAFSKSRLFQVFYFRMYFTLVVFGALVGLIFVPVILSYIGPPVNPALVVEAHKRKAEQARNSRDYR